MHIIDKIAQRISELHQLMDFALGTFGDEAGLKAFNKVAGRSAFIIQKCLTDQIILEICKLADEDRDSVSIWKIVGKDADADTQNFYELTRGENSAIKKHRNKRLAHTDKQAVLPPILVGELTECLDLLIKIFNQHTNAEMRVVQGQVTQFDPSKKGRKYILLKDGSQLPGLMHMHINFKKLYLHIFTEHPSILEEALPATKNLRDLAKRS